MQEARGASLIGDPHDLGNSRRRLGLFFAVAGLGLALDQITKWWAEGALTDRPPVPVIGTFLQFYLTHNPGAAFSSGVRFTWVFTIIAIVATVVVIRYAGRSRDLTWTLALGILLGGITGNLADRLARPPGIFRGHVVDFLMLPHWPVFNVADMLIDTAAAIIVVLTWRGIRLDGSRDRDDE